MLLEPCIVGLNDQSHIANILFKDLFAIPFIDKSVDASTSTSGYIQNHQYVYALYKTFKEEFNANLKQRGETVTSQAITFGPNAKTRFAYSLDGIEGFIRNRKPCRDIGDDRITSEGKTNRNTQSSREAFNDLIDSSENRTTWDGMDTVVKILTPVRVYFWKWDKDSVDITTILSATKEMYSRDRAG